MRLEQLIGTTFRDMASTALILTSVYMTDIKSFLREDFAGAEEGVSTEPLWAEHALYRGAPENTRHSPRASGPDRVAPIPVLCCPLSGPAASIIYKWRGKKRLLQDISFQKQVFLLQIFQQQFLVSPVYPNPGQVFLPISTWPSPQADLQSTIGVEELLVPLNPSSEQSDLPDPQAPQFLPLVIRSRWQTQRMPAWARNVFVWLGKWLPCLTVARMWGWGNVFVSFWKWPAWPGTNPLTALREICLHLEDREGLGQPCLRNSGVSSITFYPKPKVKSEGLIGWYWVSLGCPLDLSSDVPDTPKSLPPWLLLAYFLSDAPFIHSGADCASGTQCARHCVHTQGRGLWEEPNFIFSSFPSP